MGLSCVTEDKRETKIKNDLNTINSEKGKYTVGFDLTFSVQFESASAETGKRKSQRQTNSHRTPYTRLNILCTLTHSITAMF